MKKQEKARESESIRDEFDKWFSNNEVELTNISLDTLKFIEDKMNNHDWRLDFKEVGSMIIAITVTKLIDEKFKFSDKIKKAEFDIEMLY